MTHLPQLGISLKITSRKHKT